MVLSTWFHAMCSHSAHMRHKQITDVQSSCEEYWIFRVKTLVKVIQSALWLQQTLTWVVALPPKLPTIYQAVLCVYIKPL